MNIGVILGLIIILAIIVVVVYNFIKLDKATKIANIKEWLKYAVTEAEKVLGSGTGQLKLRYVYDLAIKQYPWLIKFVTIEMFNEWVKEALTWMNQQIEQNPAIANYIIGK